MQLLERQTSTVLFVNDNKEDTRFLTRGLPVEVIQTTGLEAAQSEINSHEVQGVFIDIASAQPSDISAMKSRISGKVPVFVLAGPSEVPLAIQYIKHGAKGFLVKGLSDSDSLLKLMEYATAQD